MRSERGPAGDAQAVKPRLRDARWVIDDGIPITPALEYLMGEPRVLSGRDIDAKAVADAEVLLVRSITRVDPQLLEGSRVRFVGSATAGTDHIDIGALAQMGIAWAAAPGSNALAVVEYVLSAIALSGFLPRVLNGLPVGIVGLGMVGKRLAVRLQQLGCVVRAHDPLVRDWPDNVTRASLDDVLSQPVVSLHANLHCEAPHPSQSFLDLSQAESMAQAAEQRGMGLFINAARGELLTPEALSRLLASPLTVILDAWPGEPVLSDAFLSQADWLSPHIAGHSLDAKMRGSNMLAQALVRWAGEDSHSLPTDFSVMSAGERSLEGRWSGTDATDWAADFLVSQGTLAREDARIRATGSRGLLPPTFDALRKTYQQPSEWSGQAIRMHGGAPELRNMAKRLGLSVVE